MNHKKTVFIILFLAMAMFQYGWIYGPDDAEKSKVTLFSSVFDDTVTSLGLSYTYFVNQKSELGWGIKYTRYDNQEKYLKGTNLALGPSWAHTIAFKQSGVGLRFALNLWISLYSDLKTTEEEEDITKFTARADPRMLLFAELKLSRKIKMYPALGVGATLTYMQRTEYEEMEKGLVEARLIFSVPIKIETGKKNYVMIEPTWRIFLYSNRNDTAESLSIQLGYIY
jgi:hypothetical protein